MNLNINIFFILLSITLIHLFLINIKELIFFIEYYKNTKVYFTYIKHNKNLSPIDLHISY